ncbi:prefoldin subunit [Candidatus Parvarchaeota archaeon]|nr:prefoldin subunit [Candidatus Parvarchaeota archaeon]
MNEEEEEILQQQFQAVTAQKQSMQLQLNELSRTIEEVEKSGESAELFEIVGQVMLKKSKNEIIKRLKEREELIGIRVKSINKSIEEITKKLQESKKP